MGNLASNGGVPATDVAQSAQPEKQQTRPQIEVDESNLVACYANFCRVTATPEELLIDFGVNSQPSGVPTEAIAITQRIVTNLYTAKRLLHALHLTVQRHETMFGALETDVQKRAQPT
jgi:hypothetical protein